MIRPVPGVPIEQQSEGVVLRMALFGEARGESALGKLCVAWVMKNRSRMRSSSVKVEALRDRQFSCFNPEDPNRAKLLTAWVEDPAAWRVCDAVAELFERVDMIDPTHGASHYYVEKMPNPPAWGRGHKDWRETIIEGAHVFGRAA